MTTDKPTSEQKLPKATRRRSDRFPVIVPVKVKWFEPSGVGMTEDAEAREVSIHGALLEMKGSPEVGSVIELTNLISAEAPSARVLSLPRFRKGELLGVAIELLSPTETFWGVTFRLKKTTGDLLKLEQAIRSSGLDPHVLREFRDAVDYVRKTAWAVQELKERQVQRRDPATVLPLLTAERVRRATQLSKALTTDLDAHEVNDETVGIADLLRTIESLYQRLASLVKIRESR